jgi:hypothetical protein
MPLIFFKARQTKRGVKFQATKICDYKENPIESSPNFKKSAFIQTMPSGHKGVFIRWSKQRLPIEELFKPLKDVVVENLFGHLDEIERKISQRLEKNIDWQIELALKSAK